jgi:uncharacterized protein YlxP (DUF503 family)
MYLPAPDEQLIVGVLRVVLRIPGSRSLKERRRVVAALRDRTHARHHASFADVGHLEAHDAAVVAVSIVGHDAVNVRSRLDVVRADIDAVADAFVTDMVTEILTLSGRR